MSCVPWQSVQVAATVLPPLRDLPWTVPLYSFTCCSWQVAQLTGFSFSACGILSAETSAWQSVHFRLRPPCTDAANFAPSTAIDLPSAPFASAAPWHMRHVSLTLGAGAAAPGLVLPNAAMATNAQKSAPAVRMMIDICICGPAGLRMRPRAGGPAADAPHGALPPRMFASGDVHSVDVDQRPLRAARALRGRA